MSLPTGSTRGGQGIFISYRRNDCQAQANGLHDGLAHRLGNARIFMDIDSIPAGVDFEQHIRQEIDGCDVVLVLIGDNWLDSRPGADVRRIDEPNDFVRLEIENALSNPRVRTIPVLVEGAQMPEAAQLPESIQRLARINAFDLDDRRWKADLERITVLLEGIGRHDREASTILPEMAPPPPPPVQPLRSPSGQTWSNQPIPSPGWSSHPAGPPPSMTPAAQPGVVGPSTWPGNPPVSVQRTGGFEVGWVVAFLPVICCGLLNFVPLLRSGLIRPAQRWMLIGTGVGLEIVAILGFALVGTAPQDADGTPVGAASNVGVGLVLITMLCAVTLGIVYRKARPVSR